MMYFFVYQLTEFSTVAVNDKTVCSILLTYSNFLKTKTIVNDQIGLELGRAGFRDEFNPKKRLLGCATMNLNMFSSLGCSFRFQSETFYL